MVGIRPVLAGFLVCAAASAAHADRECSPPFEGYVVDRAGIIDASSAAEIRALCTRLDEKGRAQIAVATVPSLGERSLEEFASDLFKCWGLGHSKQASDGVLVLLVPGAPGHRRIRIEVGYGLEGDLPDGKAGAIIRERAFPRMLQNDYGGAARDVVQALAAALGGVASALERVPPAATATPAPAAAPLWPTQPRDRGGAGALIGLVAMALFLLQLVAANTGRPTYRNFRLLVAALLVPQVWLAAVWGPWPLLFLDLPPLLFWRWATRRVVCPVDSWWMKYMGVKASREPTETEGGWGEYVYLCRNPQCGYSWSKPTALANLSDQRAYAAAAGSGDSSWGSSDSGGSSSSDSGGSSGGGGGESGGGGASGSI